MTAGNPPIAQENRLIAIARTARLALYACLLGLAACAGNYRDVVDEPPQAAIDGIERQAGGLVIELALRNVNDEPMTLASVAMTIELDGAPLTTARRETPLVVSARGREVLRLRVPAERAGLARLDRLGSGQVTRLPWTMDLTLGIDGGRDRETRTEGWLHPVPGQPDRFR